MSWFSHFPARLFKTGLLSALALVLCGVVFLSYLAVARNVPLQLPSPTGPYPVGRVEYDWVDASRPDLLVDLGSAPRELVVWIWYPAARNGTTTAPYLPPAWVDTRDRDQSFGVLVESNFNQIRTYSFENVPLVVTPKNFPVLIMEPGMGPMVTDYTVFAENLASHGYIVAGIQPTGTSNWTVFPDGRVALRSAKGTIPDRDTPEEASMDASRILAVWVGDVTFVIDQLAKIDADRTSPFQNRLDLENIGILGHSFGGATALAFCQKDARCKAGANMDGNPWGDSIQAPVPKPFMIFTEDYSKRCDANCTLVRQVYLHTRPGAAYFLSLSGARHFNFSDLPYRQIPILRPLFRFVGLDGAITPDRGLAVTNAYLVAFFDAYLKGSTEALLQGPSPAYPEVTFEKH